MKHIVCFSGGKDSTALIIHMIKKQMPIDEILYVDMRDWVWNEQKNHIKQFGEYLQKHDLYITSLDAGRELKTGFKKYGFPHFKKRWCTGIKRELMKNYIKNNYGNEEITQYIGYCKDEQKRKTNLYTTYHTHTPLYDDNITTSDALKICYENGFYFDNFYKKHKHLNCFMCPLQRISELKTLYMEYPDHFNYLNRLQMQTDGYFWNKKTVFELEQRFYNENKEKLKNEREQYKHG